MTRLRLIKKLAIFKGQSLIAAIDSVKEMAEPLGYSINVLDPEFNTRSIDYDSKRLNVWVDTKSVIRSFTIG